MVMASTVTDSESMQAQLRRGSILGGVLLSLLGIIAMLTPFLTGVTLSLLLGAALVVGALVHVGAAFSAGTAGNVVWQVVVGVLYSIAGISLLANPILGLATLTLLVIAFFAAEGVVEIVWAVTGAGENRVWLGLSGVISLLLAGLLFAGFPASALWAIGVLFGVNLFVTGVSMVLYGRGRGAATAEQRTEAAG